jgi:hypothetical protein
MIRAGHGLERDPERTTNRGRFVRDGSCAPAVYHRAARGLSPSCIRVISLTNNILLIPLFFSYFHLWQIGVRGRGSSGTGSSRVFCLWVGTSQAAVEEWGDKDVLWHCERSDGVRVFLGDSYGRSHRVSF